MNIATKASSPFKRQLLVILFYFSIILSAAIRPADGKTCSSVVVKQRAAKFQNLTECDIIEGHLIISAMDEAVAVNYTFPKLREVTEYVILYQAQNIVKLNNLFPNLAVIRGNKLVMDFALVIYQMDNMVEVGLTGLTHILRGGVRIEKNRNLCYVNTISWGTIVSPKYHDSIHIEENEYENMCPNVCPQECPELSGGPTKRNCWSSKSCQIDPQDLRINHMLNADKCDEQCIGGCDGNSHLHCFACANVMDEMSNGVKNCISECPSSLLLYGKWRCIEASECKNKTTIFHAETINQRRPYKIYGGKCLEFCPPTTEEVMSPDGFWTCEECRDCPKECTGATIRSLETLRKYQGCTKIMGDLAIQISGKNVVDELEKNLGKVIVITGSLKISRSFPIISLDFFKSLQEIQGTTSPDIEDRKVKNVYSLEIIENENLQKLFPPESKVKITFKNGPDAEAQKGRAFIHYNQKLCRQEIKNLLSRSDMHDPGEHSSDISYGTNGDKSVCSEKVLSLEVTATGAFTLELIFDNYQKEIAENHADVDTRALLNYEIHYREIDRATFEAKNLTKYGGRDACGNDEWMIYDHPPSPSQIDENAVINWPQEYTFISDGIKPYSYYAIFVTTLIIREGIYGGEDIKSAASDIVYFQTPEGYPGTPEEVRVTAVNYSTVNITWNEPVDPNGVISEYIIEIKHHKVKFDRLLKDRPYCEENFGIKMDQVDSGYPGKKPEDNKGKSNNNNGNSGAGQGTCDCSSCGLPNKERKGFDTSKDEKVEESQFHDELLNTIFTIDLPSISTRRKRRSPSLFTHGDNQHNNITNNLIEVKSKKSDLKDFDDETDTEIMTDEIAGTTMVVKQIVNGTVHHRMISNLTHFSKYTITITACHGTKLNPQTNQVEKRCSQTPAKLDFRTEKKEGADDIVENLTSNQDTNNSTDLWITWNDPKDPNLVIVYYKIQIKMQMQDANPLEHCLSAFDFERNGRKYTPSVRGSFFISVRAVSLAGPGAWSQELLVNAGERPSTMIWAILIPILACVLLAGLGYGFWRKQHPIGDERMHNPNYPMRNFEGFEIPRDLIIRGQELGTGSFGTVYAGIYSHPQDGEKQCAIKEAKNDKNDQLLGEADLMRTIDTPHVVKLLGVVTDGFPQFVVLELMKNGDLKKFLRSMRRTPPNSNDILLMAIQVADGMAYLSTVPNPRIIHRDLAARNCMVNDQKIVKIGDFGLARDLMYAQDYYRMNGVDWLPVRWMSPESLRDSVFSTATDVWAYGVVLWEMVTLAEQPYQGLSNDEVLNFVKNRRTMEIPRKCPEMIANLMKRCWEYDPDDRPTFVRICQDLLEHANEEFRRNSFITSALCERVLQRQELASAGDNTDELPIDVAERAPLQANGSSSGNNGSSSGNNGEVVRQLDNGHAVYPSDGINMREFNNGANTVSESLVSPRQHNILDTTFGRFRNFLRNRYHSSSNRAGGSSAAHQQDPEDPGADAPDASNNPTQAVEA